MCLVTAGHAKTCQFTVGGLSRILYGNRAELTSVAKDPDGSINAITIVTGKQMFELEFEKNTGRLAEALQVNANKYLQQQVFLTIAGSDQATKNILDVLDLAKMFCVVQFRGSGNWVLVGENSAGLEASQDESGSGQAEADLEGAAIILDGVATNRAPQVDAGLIAALLIAAP